MILSKLGLYVTLTIALLTASLAEAQPTAKIPRLCFLTLYFVAERPVYAAFLHGLRDLGYVEGHNVTIDYLSADGQFERFPILASECLRLQADIIVAATTPGVLANLADPVATLQVQELEQTARSLGV
jgi:putative ABC transport system substrate-binding protein